jgi:hypothetical protein
MTLSPDARVLLSDALRPPAGHRVDVAVGTTYSMNLTALLLAPLSFALHDQIGADDIAGIDPVRVLEAVRRYSASTTVFCQAGAIHVPSTYQRILTFVEDSVLEVMPRTEQAIFHPKVWALRFVDEHGGNPLHRVVILSRNLTFDRSWDTALLLDEDPGGVIEAAPMADFVRALPGLALPARPVSERRKVDILSLARSLERAHLAAPAPFTEGALVPIGVTDERVWPFPEKGSRLLAISPFLTKKALVALSLVANDRTLVSRASSLDLVGGRALRGWTTTTLQPLAETDVTDLTEDEEGRPNGFWDLAGGLHAKSYVIDVPGGKSHLVTGSANLTAFPWGHNVEFDCVLSGPTSSCGVNAVMDGKEGAPGLSHILAGYPVAEPDGSSDEAIEIAYLLEDFHQKLAAGNPELVISLGDEDVDATLTIALPAAIPGLTHVWPASMSRSVFSRPLAESLSWSISPENVTPFVAIETSAGEGAARVTRSCVIKARLVGDLTERRRDAVFAILASKEAVLRYLLFLLGDPSYEALLAAQLGGEAGERWSFESPGGGGPDLALFEPLVRSTGRDTGSLARVASLMDELRSRPEGRDLVPEGFDELWDVVWSVHSERPTQ